MRHKAEIVDLRFDLWGTKPLGLCIGGQQSLWVTCIATTEVVGLMRDGATQHFQADAVPETVAMGGDSIWFTMPTIDAVGRIDHAGAIHGYRMPRDSNPHGIVANDSDAWVPLGGSGVLAHLALEAGVEIVRPEITGDSDHTLAESNPRYLALDDRGSLWFTRTDSADVVRRDPDGTTESWASPDCTAPAGIALDRDAAWIADYGNGAIWRIGRTEKLLERVEPWPTGGSIEIAADGIGGCWFTEPDDDLVGHLDADARLTEYDISTYGTRPRGIAVDAAGTPWVALQSGGIIGLIPRGKSVSPTSPQVNDGSDATFY